MKIRKLRQIEVSEIGMGCMGFSHGYGNVPERAYSIRAIGEAYAYAVPIPGSKNRERILENLKASEVSLTEEEFSALESALNACTVYGHRGHVETEQNPTFGFSKQDR